MAEKTEIRVDQLPKETTKIILQLLLDKLGYYVLAERDWIGSTSRFSLQKRGETIAIVEARETATENE